MPRSAAHAHRQPQVYGVEAARRLIISEVQDVFSAYSVSTDYRHLALVADYMVPLCTRLCTFDSLLPQTFEGSLRPFNRIGMATSTSPLLKMSFETTVQFLTEAALYPPPLSSFITHHFEILPNITYVDVAEEEITISCRRPPLAWWWVCLRLAAQARSTSCCPSRISPSLCPRRVCQCKILDLSINSFLFCFSLMYLHSLLVSLGIACTVEQLRRCSVDAGCSERKSSCLVSELVEEVARRIENPTQNLTCRCLKDHQRVRQGAVHRPVQFGRQRRVGIARSDEVAPISRHALGEGFFFCRPGICWLRFAKSATQYRR